MAMDDATWARHANPLSVYSRFAALPLLTLAIWSRDWIGAWAWGAVALALLWIWINPRLFAAPESLDSWPTRAVLGERVFLHRRDQVRAHHRRAAGLLSAASLPGVVLLGVGLWQGVVWATSVGVVLTVLPKLWFLDRMVWLYADWRRDHGKDLGDV